MDDGGEIFDLPPEGIDIPADIYKKLTGRAPDPLEKRDYDICKGKTHRVWELEDADFTNATGDRTVMSSVICNGGTISKTFTRGWSWSVGGSVAPGYNFNPTYLIGISVTASYTWNEAKATAYNIACEENFPCVATFTPWFGYIKGRAKFSDLTDGTNKLCHSGYAGNVEIKVPLVRDCGSGECGAEGAWSHCYYLGNIARELCPGDLGPPPTTKECPKNLYPGAKPT
ncbi:hypothetical protein IAQ61_002451 [Plenodomus lingam]|uniref:uncharacterized protein n=1 Tax=Leptosphaeria maculans TaxID=5022 RepID=UPI00331FEFE7|nr:hypothetical protein IAQ61_002451 [Plenodomus lingam]